MKTITSITVGSTEYIINPGIFAYDNRPALELWLEGEPYCRVFENLSFWFGEYPKCRAFFDHDIYGLTPIMQKIADEFGDGKIHVGPGFGFVDQSYYINITDEMMERFWPECLEE